MNDGSAGVGEGWGHTEKCIKASAEGTVETTGSMATEGRQEGREAHFTVCPHP